MDTIALDPALWDFTVDLNGNLATFGDSTAASEATGPAMRMAQDAATQCLAFRGEVYYDATQGVRYDQILGRSPNMVFITSEFQAQALLAEGVAQAVPSLTYSSGTRGITGAVYVTDASGVSGMVNL